MPFAGPINAPGALDLIAAVRIRFMEAYSDAYKSAAYMDWEKFVFMDDPAGDLVYTIYAEPMLPLREWLGDRPMSSTDFQYWTQAVRTFARGMEIDVDDIKDDGNPAKRMMYMATAQKFAEAAAALWPSLVAEALIKGITSVWLPDGQKIFDSHPYNPRDSSLGTFRNYRANNVQGGSAAFALTYANLLTALKAGEAFKAPTGLDYPIRYSELVVPPGSATSARRLATFPMLPVQEITSGASTSAGGETVNEIAKLYSPQVRELANMPSGMWALIDANTQAERPLALKKRQEITWQYIVGGGSDALMNGGMVTDAGAVSESVFNRNKTKYGPKARGDAYFRNWWRVALFDGNATPVTTLSVVS